MMPTQEIKWHKEKDGNLNGILPGSCAGFVLANAGPWHVALFTNLLPALGGPSSALSLRPYYDKQLAVSIVAMLRR